MEKLADMTMTDWLAIIGAVTGCLAFFWDIFKWFDSGAKVRLTAAPNMIQYGALTQIAKGDKFISVEVVNRGDKKTTITHLVLTHYDSVWKVILRRKPSTNMIVPDPGVNKLPFSLDIGDRWLGLITQSEDLEKLAQNGYLFVGIYCSSKDNLIRQRLIINSS